MWCRKKYLQDSTMRCRFAVYKFFVTEFLGLVVVITSRHVASLCLASKR
jgi:hypothetical protein